jgi:hypothetical protein
VQQRLRTLWTEPEAWRPKRSNREITEEAARTFAATAERLRASRSACSASSPKTWACCRCACSSA